jgi:outer membrane protein assembly factor BamD
MIDIKRFSLAILFCFITIPLTSCIGKASKSKGSVLDYTRSAELQYMEALDEYEDRDCVSAEPHFQDVRRNFPYSRYAVLAELRLADCQFVQGNHAEAAVMYEQFVKAHPTHEDAHYAAYRRGLCYYEMIPTDWLIMPPSYERDQASTRDARMAFTHFLSTYKDSPWRKEAEELLSNVVDALVRHEIYVAEFYLNRADRRAAAVRLENVRENFKESPLVPDAMFLQAITYLEMKKTKEAIQVFSEIVNFYPEHHQSLRAKAYLKHLAAKGSGRERGGDG